jgi:predicted ATPase/DNA-binding winged helix-turn-helix (wHTH) protein
LNDTIAPTMPSVLTLPPNVSDDTDSVASTPAVLAFGPFRLLRAPLALCRGDEEVRLGRRALDLLQALLARPGEILSRHELEASVWPRSVVEDSSLRVHVAALRRALGDGVDGARYIANVPGRGYCFVGQVAKLKAEPSLGGRDAPAPSTRINNLPISLNRLIGRDAVIALLTGELQKRRLASIVGHGGIGKTALALEVAARADEHYPDGVCFVDLAPVTAAAHLTEVVATALGLSLAPERSQEGLEAWLRARRLLLVIDNCEHLLDSVAALLERVLQRAPGLDVLATSREPLDAQGEWVHRLQPLEAPPDGPALDHEGVLAYSAVQLLAERAAASLDSFALDSDNAHLAAALCRRLDGVPLAIEFAASRIGLLGLQGVCVQLDDRLRLLGSGRRTSLPRHRTLRALLDWSYLLLSETQQQVLRRCGVFKAAFTLEAACAVAADETLTPEVVRDCLLDLVAKSLVRAELTGDPATYSLLEITRAYALDHLAQDAGRNDVFRAHAQQTLYSIRRSAVRWDQGPHGQWFARFAPCLGNLRAALDWCFGAEGAPEIGVALLAEVSMPVASFFDGAEYHQRVGQAIAAIDAGVPVEPLHELRIRSTYSVSSTPLPASASSIDPHLRALDRLSRDPARFGEDRIEAFYMLFAGSLSAGDYRSAADFAQRSQDAAHGGGVAEIEHGQRLRAQAAHYLGDHDRAAELAAMLAQRTEDPRLPLRLASWVPRKVSMQIILARVLWMEGQGERAIALAQETVRDASPRPFAAALSQALCLCALPIAIWMGDEARVREWIEQLRLHLECSHQPYWASWHDQLRRVLALRDAQVSLAAGMPGVPDALQLDHLVTFGAWAHNPQALARVKDGLVGWNAPESWRVHGELVLARGGAAAEAEAAMRHALALANRQHAWAWSLRAAISLVRLHRSHGCGADAPGLLAHALARCDGGGADVRQAQLLLAPA